MNKETNYIDEILKEKEIIRLASLVGTDAKNPERNLLDFLKQKLEEVQDKTLEACEDAGRNMYQKGKEDAKKEYIAYEKERIRKLKQDMIKEYEEECKKGKISYLK
ncbi:MAG: hypothetical protein PF549_02750 [Patescibacteria group bacterium]|jgi:ATP-dependent protease HslVU (ClpYQ) peptidase subunit|nr:hypothetical protein [Patescibacteria group bacterium]